MTDRPERLSFEQRIARGKRAQQLLDDPLIVHAFEQVELTLQRRWSRSLPLDSALREHLYQMRRGAQLARTLLTRVADDGRIAAQTAEKLGNTTPGRPKRRPL